MEDVVAIVVLGEKLCCRHLSHLIVFMKTEWSLLHLRTLSDVLRGRDIVFSSHVNYSTNVAIILAIEPSRNHWHRLDSLHTSMILDRVFTVFIDLLQEKNRAVLTVISQHATFII